MADPRGDEALAELLRAAAPTTVPPAGFDHGTVLAAARRAQARRRRLLAGGAAAVVVVLAGGGAAAVLGGGAGEQSTASSAVAGTATGSAGAAGIAPRVRPPDQLPQDPAPTGTAPGVGPQLLGAGTCGPTDRAVYTALQLALPELAARPPYPLHRACPDGTTGVAVAVSAGDPAGRVEALVGPTAVTATDGATGTATTAGGRTVTIVSVPAAGSSAGPYADRLDDVARRVASALG